MRKLATRLPWVIVLAGCGPTEVQDVGQSSSRTEEGLTGCQGKASSTVPASGDYFLTTFGAGSDSGTMSCGSNTNHGNWYYAASRQRYGCGAHIQIEANGKCVVAQTDDYGPDVCVENAAGGPIIDASPLVAEALFGGSSAGWSDHFRIHVTVVDKSTPLGVCTGGNSGPMNDPPPQKDPASCYSSTLAKQVPTGTCVQSSSDGAWYHCDDGSWDAGETGCQSTYPFCHSATLGRYVSERTCVQSASDHVWYQCGPSGWETPVSNGAGPMGGCSAEYSL